jgi:hypothetical protein
MKVRSVGVRRVWDCMLCACVREEGEEKTKNRDPPTGSVVTMAQKIEKKICSTSKKYGTGNQSVVQGGGRRRLRKVLPGFRSKQVALFGAVHEIIVWCGARDVVGDACEGNS